MTGFSVTIKFSEKIILFPPRIELGTLRVLSARDDHYTTETGMKFSKAVQDAISLLRGRVFSLN